MQRTRKSPRPTRRMDWMIHHTLGRNFLTQTLKLGCHAKCVVRVSLGTSKPAKILGNQSLGTIESKGSERSADKDSVRMMYKEMTWAQTRAQSWGVYRCGKPSNSGIKQSWHRHKMAQVTLECDFGGDNQTRLSPDTSGAPGRSKEAMAWWP